MCLSVCTHTLLDRPPTYHDKFALDLGGPVQRVVLHALPKRVLVQVRREIAHRRADPAIQRAAIRQVASEAHARGADAAIAAGEREQHVDGQRGVLVVRGQPLARLERVAPVGAGAVVRQRRRPDEAVVRGRRGDEVAARADLAGEAGDGAGYWGGGEGMLGRMEGLRLSWRGV